MHLDDLIAQVHGDEPLDRLSSAMTVKADLDELKSRLAEMEKAASLIGQAMLRP